MQDAEIVQLFWNRDERAIGEAKTKYGAYCAAIAGSILGSTQDAEEAVQDTWFAAWSSIPPNRPALLKTYLGKLARRSALKKWRGMHALKRGGGEVALALEELTECLSASENVECEAASVELSAAIDRFLAALKPEERRRFICRYWYMDSIEEIGKRYGFAKSKVKAQLYRLRKRLHKQLEKEGFLNEK